METNPNEEPGSQKHEQDPLATAGSTPNAPTLSSSPEMAEAKHEALLEVLALSRERTDADYRRLATLSALLPVRGEKGWTDFDTAEMSALLAEYGSLRQESMNTINNRVQILVLGFAAIAAFAGAAVTSDRLSKDPFLVIAVFSGVIPLVCVFVFMVWLSEAIRSHRVGYHIASDVEARINAKLGRLAVTWETALWTGILKRDEKWGPSMMALAIVGALGALAPWCGVYVTNTGVDLHGRLLWEVLAPYAVFGLTGLYGWYYLPRLKNVPVIRSGFLFGAHRVTTPAATRASEKSEKRN
jgi:hypothetical protein